MEKKEKDSGRIKTGTQLRFGAICIAFLILGYQVALFVHRAAVLEIEARRDAPDTVFVYSTDVPGIVPQGKAEESRTVRHNARHSPAVEKARELNRRTESFRFNPNEAGPEDLQRLGFSQKQAQAIINYRNSGGRFHRKEDFKRSFVVADSVYRRLEPFIDIPLLDINLADSSQFDALPGIGPYFASQMVKYREALGLYSTTAQLMEIYRFDSERFSAISDLICCSPGPGFGLWTLPAAQLREHPHIKNMKTARAIVLFRENTPADCLSVDALCRAGILSLEQARRLKNCKIEPANSIK